MRSMRSTSSSGVGTQMTSLPACPTCGANSPLLAACPQAENAAMHNPAATTCFINPALAFTITPPKGLRDRSRNA